MASKEARERKLKEIQEIAAGWGKIIAREAFPNGPGLDVTSGRYGGVCHGGFSGAGQRGGGDDDRRRKGSSSAKRPLVRLVGRMCPLETVPRVRWSCAAATPRWTNR